MSEQLYDHIPSLDLNDFNGGDPTKKRKFVDELGAAYHSIGFVAIRGHYLTDDLTEKLYSSIKRFFALPDNIKQKYEIPGLAGQRGYIGKGKEHAKGRNTGDLKEFYHVGQQVTTTIRSNKNIPTTYGLRRSQSFAKFPPKSIVGWRKQDFKCYGQ